MGIFDGFLICSDLDGTFDRKCARNVEALDYYKENGGLFTFCSGRSVLNAYEFGLKEFANAPVCLCNGAIVYDFCKKEILFEKRLPFKAGHIATALSHWLPKATYIYMPVSPLGYVKKSTMTDEMYDITPLKMVWGFETPDDADTFLLQAREKIRDVYVSKSYPLGVEFTHVNATKGSAIRFIKNVTRATQSIGVGDYGNDLPLLQNADVAVAVDNAIPEIKAAADMTVCHFGDGAIADIIYKIEEKLKNA